MKIYIYEIGAGSGEEMKTVAFAQELLADSLGEAIDKARAMTRKRAVHADENIVHIVDETELGREMIWVRSAAEIRNG